MQFYTKNKCSVRLLRPQRLHDGLWRVLSALEDAFQCVVGANTYLTPPNSQGFAPHYDDVEVFVCQVRQARECACDSS
jgi:lysine-specific demethylase/histidyl-hydroxylase NO66